MGVKAVVPAAKSRLFIAAKGGGDIPLAETVDRDCARPDCARRPMGPFQIAGEDRCGQAIVGIVGHFDRLINIGNGDHGQDRAENLLLRQAVVGADIVKDGWLHIGAVNGFAAQDDPGIALGRQVAADLVEMILVDECAKMVGRVQMDRRCAMRGPCPEQA